MAGDPLICGVCGKVYKIRKRFHEHLLLHLHEQNADKILQASSATGGLEFNRVEVEEDNIDNWPETAFLGEQENENGLDFLFSEDAEVDDPIPEKQRKTRKGKASSKARLVTCSVCGKGYATFESFFKHKSRHAMEVACARVPDLDVILEDAVRLSVEVLGDIASVKSGKQCDSDANMLMEMTRSEAWREFLELMFKGLYTCFSSGKFFVVPSHLRDAFMRNVGVFTINMDARGVLISLLERLLNSPSHDFLFKYFH